MGGGMSIEMWLAEDDDAAFRSELQRNVFDEFARAPTLDHADISVSVDDHVVTLSGAVKTYPEKVEAERAAKRVRGVQAVRNHVAVVLPTSSHRSDREIAKAAAQALESDVLVPHALVRVGVISGWVQLAGTVRLDAERRAAVAAVQLIVGVKGVANAIVVKAGPLQEDLQPRLTAALARCAGLHGDKVEVETIDGIVLLHGRVRSLAERDEAEQAVWALPGVTSVQDDLRVQG